MALLEEFLVELLEDFQQSFLVKLFDKFPIELLQKFVIDLPQLPQEFLVELQDKSTLRRNRSDTFLSRKEFKVCLL